MLTNAHNHISPTAPASGNANDRDYQDFLGRMHSRFAERAKAGPLFTTDIDLWPMYLNSFPEHERKHHDCNACRHFIQRYGSLVTVDEHGGAESVLWDSAETDSVHLKAIFNMEERLDGAQVTGVFLTTEGTLGQPKTGNWIHLSVPVPLSARYKARALNASQAAAAKLEDFKNVSRALAEYPRSLVAQAVSLLRSDALTRSEKVLGAAEWLNNLHTSVFGERGRRRYNIIWHAVANAPDGFCHVRSSMLGTLLDDLGAGVSFDVAKRKFASKMDPLKYQRPQAAPSAGNIAAAEKLFEQLGLAPAMERRFARVDEVDALWVPRRETLRAKTTGLFAGVRPKTNEVPPLYARDYVVMTFAKFSRDILPHAESIEINAPFVGNFFAMTTATDPKAPQILQWNNPFSLYLYDRTRSTTCCSPRYWGIAEGWNKVTAVSLRPHQWFGGNMPHHGSNALFYIEGAKDSGNAGLAIFPETLISDLHPVRSTIAAFSQTRRLSGREEASACGLMLGDGAPVRVRVTSGGVKAEYTLDRME